jgi:hypothetical protein
MSEKGTCNPHPDGKLLVHSFGPCESPRDIGRQQPARALTSATSAGLVGRDALGAVPHDETLRAPRRWNRRVGARSASKAAR